MMTSIAVLRADTLNGMRWKTKASVIGLVLSVATVTGLFDQTVAAATATTAPDDQSGTEDEAATDDEVTSPDLTVPLVRAPSGCDTAELPYLVFIGTVVGGDYRTRRFSIDQIRAGQTEPFAHNNQIDIRYGIDAQYLREGETYLVGAQREPTLSILVSRVTPPVEAFGGDQVIGLSETDAVCPESEDAFRTLTPAGQPVEASMLQPLTQARSRLLGAILIPIGVAVVAIFLLAMLRTGSRAAARAVSSSEYRQ